MGLGEILAAVYRAIGILLTLLGIANAIDAKPVAEEDSPFKIQTATLATANFIIDPVFGIPRILSNQAALLAALGSVQTALLAAIGTPQQAGVAVTLPSPPTGYGGGASASDVWAYVNGFVGETSETMFSELWHWLKNVALSIDPAGNSPFAILRFPANYTLTSYAGGIVTGFKADLSVVSSGDTLKSWLLAQNPTWTFPGPTNGQLKAQPPSPYYAGFDYFVAWSEPFFELMKRIQLGTLVPPVEVAPVWPGLAGVTLGSPVALSPTCVVTGPMHGVIIDITSAAPRQVYQVFGGMQGYRFVGGLQFVDDNGEAERIQSIGMQHEVIVCKSMAEAASCSIRTDSAVSGTATPFVIT